LCAELCAWRNKICLVRSSGQGAIQDFQKSGFSGVLRYGLPPMRASWGFLESRIFGKWEKPLISAIWLSCPFQEDIRDKKQESGFRTPGKVVGFSAITIRGSWRLHNSHRSGLQLALPKRFARNPDKKIFSCSVAASCSTRADYSSSAFFQMPGILDMPFRMAHWR